MPAWDHPRLTAARAWVGPRARGWLQRRVRSVLAERAAVLREADDVLYATRDRLLPLERAVDRATHLRERGPLHRGTTVHAAHDRDPRVAAAFAARGLPRCLDCAVGAVETLEEAASGEGFDLDVLLAELGHGPRSAAG